MKKTKKNSNDDFKYSKSKSFENLETVQHLALTRKGKDDEANPDISAFLKAEELKGKLCGLYTDKDPASHNVNVMGSVFIEGKLLDIRTGEVVNTENNDDRIT